MTVAMSAPDPLDPAVLRDPFAGWAQARRDAPVAFSPAFGMWLVARREHVIEVLRDPMTFSSARNLDAPPPPAELAGRLPDGLPWTPQSLANGEGPEHRLLRRAVAQAIGPRRAAALRPQVERTARELVAGIAPRGEGDVLTDVAFPLAERTIALATGLAPDDLAPLRAWLAALDVTIAGVAPAPELAAAAREHAAFAERCGVRLAAPERPDGVAAALGGCPVAPARRLSALLQVLMAGVATTAHLVANTTRLVLERPELHARLAAEPGLAARVIEEALRHTSPVRGMPRTATRGVELGGARIAAGDRLFVLFGSANRDERFVADPDELRIDREDGRDHLAFGRGTHFCPGAPLARLEAATALTALLALPGLALVPGPPPEPYPTLSIHAFRRLPVRWRALR
jgi:cytochrome P450